MKIAVVDEQEVFQKFDMTTEASARIEKVRAEGTKKLDSLQSILTLIKMSREEQLEMQNVIGATQQEYREKLQLISDKEFSMVWNRINTYSAEFAKKRGLSVLMAKKNEGIWYNENGSELTTELIKYANEKYNNK